MKVINGENMILGRLATHIAKKILLGQEIALVNCEKMIISGSRKEIIAKYVQKMQMGHTRWGPFYFKRPDSFVKRSIRGMVPRKRIRGREALHRLKCYIGLPKQFTDSTLVVHEPANVKKIPNLKSYPI